MIYKLLFIFITTINFSAIAQGDSLQAYNFISTAFKSVDKPKQTIKAKRVVKISSSFTISEDTLANVEDKIIYMCIIAPNDKCLFNDINNTFKVEHQLLNFSASRAIRYENKSVEVAIYYYLKYDLISAGNYTIKIYCDGILIGTDQLVLK